MSDVSDLDFDNMTAADFEEHLPDLFANARGKLSNDPRLSRFFAAHPDCAALVSDFETIAETAKSLFEPLHEPSDAVWSNIASKLNAEPDDAAAVDLSE